MPAYLIAEHRIEDADRFEAYRRRVAPMIERTSAAATSRAAARTAFSTARGTPPAR